MNYFKKQYENCKTSEDMEALLKKMQECYDNMIGSIYSDILYDDICELKDLIYTKKREEENEHN